MTVRRFAVPMPDGTMLPAERYEPSRRGRPRTPARLPARLVLAHGAGAPKSSAFMVAFARGLAERGLTAVLFDFAYMARGRRLPDRMPQLMEQMRAVAQRTRRGMRPGERLLLGGKSMGGRVATYLAAEGFPCEGLILLGYPLHPAGQPAKQRSAHFERALLPALFVSGTRDLLAGRSRLARAVRQWGGAAHLHWIDDGDHSLAVRRRSGRTTEAAWEEAMDAIASFVSELAGPVGPRRRS